MESTDRDGDLRRILERLDAIESRLAKWEVPSGVAPVEPVRQPVVPVPAPEPPVVAKTPVPPGKPVGEPAVRVKPQRAERPERAPAAAAERSDGLGSAEKFIGTKLIGWIGSLALLFGTALFLKLAFDRGWISPGLRIVMGTAAGLALFGGAEVTFRRNLRAFSATLAGAGIAILTLTNWAAFDLYGFTEFYVAFLLGCATTAAGFAWSAWRALLPALLLAEIGGFLTPVLISRPTTSPWGLTIYLGLLILASCTAGSWRSWRSPAALAVGCTIPLFSAASDRWVYGFEEDSRAVATALAQVLLTLIFFADFGVRALTGRLARKLEAGLTIVLGLWGAVLLGAILRPEHDDWLGTLALVESVALAALAWLHRAHSKPLPGTALSLAILAATASIPCLLSGAPRGIAFAAFAVALAWLERRTRAFIPMLGSLLNHALAAVCILQFGKIHEQPEFLWSERATVCAAAVVSLFFTDRLLKQAGEIGSMAAKGAFVAMQVATAFLLFETVPGTRVTAAWCGQALSLGYLAFRRSGPEKQAMALLLLVAAAAHFCYKEEYRIDPDAWPFLHLRAGSLVLAAAALALVGMSTEKPPESMGESAIVLKTAAALLGAFLLGMEASFVLSRVYGAFPPVLNGNLSLAGATYVPLWNGRFAFLAVSALALAATARWKWVHSKESEWMEMPARVFLTALAHALLWLALSLEAMGLAEAQVGADPLANRELFYSSRVQGALSFTMALVPAVVLAVGFRRSKVHRYFGLAGLLVTVGKVVMVDLSRLAIEWRMLVLLGLGALLLAGAFLYGRALRDRPKG
jgi:hypothetical protein